MKQYLETLQYVLDYGSSKPDRTGTGTLSVFGHQLKFDVSGKFPLLTTKKIHFKSIIHELLWFLSGSTNVRYLQDNGVRIWNEWADEKGELGPVYGEQWRAWKNYKRSIILGTVSPNDPVADITFGIIDQVSNVMKSLKEDPFSRRHIITAWNPADLPDMALSPCHCLFQFNVRENILDLHLYQRSADIFLGVPFNIASYALLLCMVAHQLNYRRGSLIVSYGDLHLYKNHIDQVDEQLCRKPLELPELSFVRKPGSIFDYKFEDIQILGYTSHPAIKAPVAV